MARRWAERDTLTLRLPPRFLGLQPGMVASLALAPATWTITRAVVEGMVVVVDLRPAWHAAAGLPADAGRSTSPIDEAVAPITLALVEMPSPSSPDSGSPTLYLAASSPGRAARRATVQLSATGWTSAILTTAKKATLGRALNTLAPGQAYLIDDEATVEIELFDPDQWLIGCEDAALIAGGNLALVGSELIQFGDVEPMGPGRFRLSHLVRGRAGTDWAMALHEPDETFILADRDTLKPIVLPAWARGAAVSAAHYDGVGDVTASAAATVAGDAIRPLAPVKLTAAIDGGGDLQISWTRRSRSGLAWVDDIDAPLDEGTELYDVTIHGSAGSATLQVSVAAATIDNLELVPLGSGDATVMVRQIGKWAASRPAEISISLP